MILVRIIYGISLLLLAGFVSMMTTDGINFSSWVIAGILLAAISIILIRRYKISRTPKSPAQ